jgi:hypothetical protein
MYYRRYRRRRYRSFPHPYLDISSAKAWHRTIRAPARTSPKPSRSAIGGADVSNPFKFTLSDMAVGYGGQYARDYMRSRNPGNLRGSVASSRWWLMNTYVWPAAESIHKSPFRDTLFEYAHKHNSPEFRHSPRSDL